MICPPGDETSDALSPDRIIHTVASRLSGVFCDGAPLGFTRARTRIVEWLDNFRGVIPSLDPCFKTLEHLEILNDEQILSEALTFLTEHPSPNRPRSLFTCLGAESESSARIMRFLNTNDGYFPNLHSLLAELTPAQADSTRIVFIDDFINSGGQLCSILKSWCDSPGSGNRSHHGTTARHRARGPLSVETRNQFSQVHLVFIFARGMNDGRLKARDCLEKLGLSGEIHCLQTYSDTFGTFGDRDEIAAIRARLDSPVGETSIFRGWSRSHVTDYFEICEAAGDALLRRAHPDWSEEKTANRRLGYGNSAQRYLTQANVPTCSLTALWLGGVISIAGRVINWKPLLPRRTKDIGGSESSSSHKELIPSILSRPKELLDDLTLDSSPHGSPALDITLSIPLEPIHNLTPASDWLRAPAEDSQGKLAYTGLLIPEVREHLGIGRDTPGASAVWVMKPMRLGCLNNHLQYIFDGASRPVQISSIHLTRFGGLVGFLSIRLQFRASGMTIREALGTAHQLSILNPKGDSPSEEFWQQRSRQREDTRRTSIRALFRWAEKLWYDGSYSAYPWRDEPRQLSVERANVHVFIRESGALFDLPEADRDSFIRSIGGLSRPSRISGSSQTQLGLIHMDADAVICSSPAGALALCGAKATCNTGYLGDHFQRHYSFLSLFADHISRLCTRMGLASTTDEAARDWLQRMARFPFGNACQKPHMNAFLEVLARERGLAKRITETLAGYPGYR
ncbi:MAG: hypothetical protein HQM09_22375 [Candidatus Riflebacteria bacterium]|nr:hypothetical protein [Candidatus Riflebacteria bacterium]